MTNNKTVFTPEQLSAINHDCRKHGSVIISAAAGSGKTAVLVEHIIQLLCGEEKKIPADKIVTVTFTKKAAAEIKARLEKALRLRISETKKAEWLNEQLIRLDDARISTISAFCLDIIRVYAAEAGLNAGFRNLDELEADEFMTKAMENTLEKLYDRSVFSDAERISLDMLTGEIGDEALSAILHDFHNAASKQAFPDDWLGSLLEYSGSENEAENIVIHERILPAVKHIFDEKTESFLQLSGESVKVAYGTKMQAKLEKDYKLAQDWQEWALCLCLTGTDFLKQKNEIKEKLKTLLPRKSETASYGKTFDENDLSILKENQKEYKQIIIEMSEWARLLLAFGDTGTKLSLALKTLIKLYKMLAEEFAALKLSANAVDFNDMEHLCLELLRKENGRYAEEIGAGLYEIIVDEFQDSNSVQYAIFTSLSGGRNLFLVGDIKQSIYRFRNADPRVFGAVLRDSRYKKLYLNRNFRSGKEVINAVNGVFGGLMTEELGGTNYGENARLIYGRKEDSKKDLSEEMTAELCLLYLDSDKKDDNIYGEINEPADVKILEARYIARRIKKMADEKFPVTAQDGGQRACDYGDFAVIVSALKTVENEFLQAFGEENIPVQRGGSGDFLSLREASLAVDLLTVIDNPYTKDLAMASVLMSPLYDMSANDLALIKTAGRADKNNETINLKFKSGEKRYKPKNGLFDCLRAYTAEPENKNTETYKKAERFLEDLIRWRAFSENNPPPQLIRHIYDEGTFLPLIAGAENHVKAEKVLSNLRLLLYYADNLSGFTGLDIKHLSGFINFLSNKMNNGKKLGEADASGASNAVKLLTIHASKGLEFPICFIARTNSAFNKRETAADVIFDDDYGIAARYIDPFTLRRYDSLTHRLAKKRGADGLTGEEVRKLYVAMTRAMDKLILVGAVKEKDGELKIKSDTYLEWIYSSKAVETGAIKPVYPAPDALLQCTEAAKESGNAEEFNNHEDEKAAVLNAISAVYDRKELTNIPKKLTATQIGVMNETYNNITDADSDEPSVFPRYPSFLKEKKLTGKKRGDCYHKLMRLLSFEAGNYAEQIKILEERFSKEEYKAIDVPQIISFFESDLGKRAVKSSRICKEIPLYTEISFTELFGRFSDGEENEEDKKTGKDNKSLDGKELDKKFTERPFVQGVADMFFYEDGEIVLVDYKTNRRPTADGLKKEYRNQLRIYKKAIEEMTGVKVKECWIYSFEIGEVAAEV